MNNSMFVLFFGLIITAVSESPRTSREAKRIADEVEDRNIKYREKGGASNVVVQSSLPIWLRIFQKSISDLQKGSGELTFTDEDGNLVHIGREGITATTPEGDNIRVNPNGSQEVNGGALNSFEKNFGKVKGKNGGAGGNVEELTIEEQTGSCKEGFVICNLLEHCVNMVFNALIGGFVLYRYLTRVYNVKPVLSEGTRVLELDFQEEFCMMTDDLDVLISVCCDPCAACRITDTYITVGLIDPDNGWKHAIILFMVQSLCPGFAVFFYYPCRRTALRTKLGGENRGMCHVLDWLTMVICTPCALSQEGREADSSVGVKTNACTCRLSCPYAFPIGEPISIDQMHSLDRPGGFRSSTRLLDTMI